jgi:chromosome segregation ATPase
MLETSREIERNQLGSAGQQQEEVADSLAQLLDILSNRTEHELGRRLKQLRAAATELTEVQRQLERLARQARAASEQAEPTERQRQLERLTKEHNRLAEEAERLARRLERLEANEAGASVSQGGDKIGEAGQSSQQGNGQKTLEDLAQGKQNLDEAQRQLQQKIAQTEQDLFFEQVAKLEQAIEGLVKRQQAVIDETVRLENLKSTQDGEWTPSQRTSVGSLTAQQRDLLTETTAFAQKLASAEAFSLALAGSVREMTRAAARLERLLTDTETQTAEQVAVTRLSQLLEALQPEPPPDTPPEQEPGGSGGGGQPPGMPPGDALHLLAELKLLKLMQAEINRRTKELEVLQQSGTELTPDQQQELADLATEQGQLADLALNLGEKSAASTGANPPEPAPQQPPDENRRPGVERNIDEELNRSLDNELLPGGE